MQLFLFLNDLAGRWHVLDGAARLFYVSALPLLGTLFLAQIFFSSGSPTGASRSKTALALAFALVLGALLVWGFDLVAGWLHLGVLSPRPWMTRRVNWLVVEPQDNSFPCTEVVLASAIAAASWHLSRRWGALSWVVVALFALTRLFCGNNYFADVFVGFGLGLGSFLLCVEACERHLAFGVRARKLSLNASPLAVLLAGCYVFGLLSPRFASKLGIGHPADASAPVVKIGATSTAATLNQGEGEGMDTDEGQAEELALAKRSTLFLPQVESFLRGRLSPLAHPFQLLDVEVAPVKAGTTSYRCAAIRFEVPVAQNQERRAVADCAAKLVKTAFFFDSHLQNVDVIAVARDEGRNLDHSQMVFVGDEVPVFTASIQRKNLVEANAVLAAQQNADGLTWLRARSLVYINERVLPYQPYPTPTPMPILTPTPKGTPLASPSPLAGAGATPLPTATTQMQATPTLKVAPHVSATARATPQRSARPTIKPLPTATKAALKPPRVRPLLTPTPLALQGVQTRPTPAHTPLATPKAIHPKATASPTIQPTLTKKP